MAGSSASVILGRSLVSQLMAPKPYVIKGSQGAGASFGVGGGGSAPSGPSAGGGDRSVAPAGGQGPSEESTPLGLPMPVLIGGGIAVVAVVGLVIYKVKKRKR